MEGLVLHVTKIDTLILNNCDAAFIYVVILLLSVAVVYNEIFPNLIILTIINFSV